MNSMAFPQKQQLKATSRWGFLQQAVASVESRLDNILGEEDELPGKVPSTQLQPAKEDASSKRPSMEVSRSGASTPVSDRLQERLAKAMTKKGGSRPETPVTTADVGAQREVLSTAQTATVDLTSETAQQALLDETADILKSEATSQQAVLEQTPDRPSDEATAADSLTRTTQPGTVESTDSRVTVLPTNTDPAPPRRNSAEAGVERQSGDSARPSSDAHSRRDAALLRTQLDSEATQRQMQDEVNGYMERIDALQAKLQYLTKEAAENSKHAAAAAQNGTVEKKLFEKDERIALLIDEGQKLSKTEMKHLTTIKKLRTQANASTKEHDLTKARAEKAERSLRQSEDLAKRAEAAAKRAEQSLTSSQSSKDDLDAVKKERSALSTTLADIKAQLARANTRADAAENKAVSEQLEKERKRNAELQDDIRRLKVERELDEEKLRREIKDLKSSLDREKEHARVMETEMLGEQAALESRLESFRTRAEEASSGDHGEVGAKLLRQVETLQNQYAVAGENWHGIETSLMGRITVLEKERDEVTGRESDARRKLREAALKIKRQERELEEVQYKLPELQRSQVESEQDSERTSRKNEQLEADLSRAQKELDDHKAQSERDMARRLEEERAKWAASIQIQRLDSPSASIRKGSGLGVEQMHPLHSDRGVSRRPSIMQHFDSNTPPRQHSVASFKGFSNGIIPETPSIVTAQDADEYFNSVPPTPTSNTQAASPRMNDLISTSTVGAGPSVQLVERMSANVRRLESEKAASKDEIARLTSQRDQSRTEVVNLMTEVDEKRRLEDRLKGLEEEHKGLDERHRTTLELLGEKSEQVQELKADILDVKQMYRQLADQMK